jgi:hypothetical protein
MASLFVKPGPNPDKPGTQLRVRHPAPSRAPLSREGEEVPANHYWRRRLAQGDVVLATKPSAQPKQEPSKPREAVVRQFEPKGNE